jgi:predicted GIY-YIG superfamily endonuclease
MVNNTVKLKCISRKQDNKYNNSGVYQLKCGSCEQVYIGQTGRDFKTRFKEHVHEIRFNLTKSKYAQHILEHGHEYGPIDDIMDILRIAPKGKMPDILEKIHIYKSSIHKAIVNEQNTKDSNILSDLALNRRK